MAGSYVRWGLGIIGTVGIVDTSALLILGYSINLGIVLPGIAGALMLGYVLVRSEWLAGATVACGNPVLWFFWGVFGFWLVSFVIIEGLIVAAAFSREAPGANWLIVLGSGVRGDAPSPILRTRLDKAVEYLVRHPAARAVVSGGYNRGAAFSEAEVMERYLIQRGIAPMRILREACSASTMENLKNSNALISDLFPGKHLMTAVTNEFHRFRVEMLARRLELTVNVVTAPSPWYVLPNLCLREYFAVIKSAIVDR